MTVGEVGVGDNAAQHGTQLSYGRGCRCDSCRRAHADYNRERRHLNGYPVFQPAQCGTEAGYHRHRRLGEQPCSACRRAHADYTVPRNRQRRRRQYPLGKGRVLAHDYEGRLQQRATHVQLLRSLGIIT